MFDFVNDLKQTICTIIGPQEGQFGQGCLISPNVVLTARHVVTDYETGELLPVTIYNPDNQTASILRGAAHIVGTDLRPDIAIIQIDRCLSDRNISVAPDDSGALSMKGVLLTRFNEQAVALSHNVSVHAVGINEELSQMDEVLGVRSYFCEAAVRGGYSGSPIFNQKGEIVSLVSGVFSFRESPDKPLWRQPPLNFGGVHTSDLVNFAQRGGVKISGLS